MRDPGHIVIDPREEDLGLAWRKRIPVLLERYEGRLEGVTQWSDWVICQTFARQHGLILTRPPRAFAAPAAVLYEWAFAAAP